MYGIRMHPAFTAQGGRIVVPGARAESYHGCHPRQGHQGSFRGDFYRGRSFLCDSSNEARLRALL